jgi:hypothetical protein
LADGHVAGVPDGRRPASRSLSRPDRARSASGDLFVISFDDGAAYARAGERARDGEGQLREVFRFDPDGSLTERAKRRFTSLA